MENNKSTGNDGLTKEFYCTFWIEIKNIFYKFFKRIKMFKST